MVTFNKNKLNELLKSLKEFPQLREVRELRKRLQKEAVKIKPKPKPTVAPAPAEIKAIVNAQRSTKLQRYWRYVKLIRDNFPDFSVKQIRKQLTVRQQGQETDIPDAVWQNPSP